MTPLINITSFAQFGNIEVERWFQFRAANAFQLITDHELQDTHATLAEVLLHYPTITTYSIIMNPWARAKFLYNNMIQSTIGPFRYITFDNGIVEHFDTSTFEDFVMTWPDVSLPGSSVSTASQQIEFILAGKLKTVDFVLYAETLVNDFKQIQQYSGNYDKFLLRESIYPSEYREMYTDEMKQKITVLFDHDIKYFNYQF